MILPSSTRTVPVQRFGKEPSRSQGGEGRPQSLSPQSQSSWPRQEDAEPAAQTLVEMLSPFLSASLRSEYPLRYSYGLDVVPRADGASLAKRKWHQHGNWWSKQRHLKTAQAGSVRVHW